MDCPHCKTSNLPGAEHCSNCRSPLAGSARMLVAELTPPTGTDGATFDGGTPSTPSPVSDVTLGGSSDFSMSIPPAWSVPPPAEGSAGGQSFSPASVNPGMVLGSRYEIVEIL